MKRDYWILLIPIILVFCSLYYYKFNWKPDEVLLDLPNYFKLFFPWVVLASVFSVRVWRSGKSRGQIIREITFLNLVFFFLLAYYSDLAVDGRFQLENNIVTNLFLLTPWWVVPSSCVVFCLHNIFKKKWSFWFLVVAGYSFTMLLILYSLVDHFSPRFQLSSIGQPDYRFFTPWFSPVFGILFCLYATSQIKDKNMKFYFVSFFALFWLLMGMAIYFGVLRSRLFWNLLMSM